MIIYTDNKAYVLKLFPNAEDWKEVCVASDLKLPIKTLAERLFDQPNVLTATKSEVGEWEAALVSGFSPESQYDLLIALCGEGVTLPDRMFCLADSGTGFHGQRQRPWIAEPGNIHLSVCLCPDRQIENFAVAFPILAAVSVVEAIDGISGLRGQAGIKWVNDILLNNGKVAGFITHIQSMEEIVKTAILGIGLNVEKTPQVSQDAFVPRVTSVKQQAPDSRESQLSCILESLLACLERNYNQLLQTGSHALLDIYRRRSLVMGRKVRVIIDDAGGEPQEIAAGRVVAIGEGLELYLEGQAKPVWRGRLILES